MKAPAETSAGTPAYKIGDTVLVRDLEAEEGLKGHMRAPLYCRNQRGRIERVCGKFGNPETLAYGGDGRPEQVLYRVRFRQTDLWPDYAGSAQDQIEIELYQHWLKHAP